MISISRVTPYALALCALAAAWKLASLAVGDVVLPAPETAVPAFLAALGTAAFWGHFLASAGRAMAGMSLAWLAAFPLGILMGGSRRVDAVLAPLLFLTYPVPKIVLLPVLLILLGLGDASKVAMVALILSYQILVTVRDGVRSIHPKYVDTLRSLGAGRLQVLREVYLPAALPYGFTALRLGTGVSVAVLFFVESFATRRGLGFLIMDAWGAFDFTAMFTGILGMSLMGVALYEAVNLLERRACRWLFCGGRRGVTSR